MPKMEAWRAAVDALATGIREDLVAEVDKGHESLARHLGQEWQVQTPTPNPDSQEAAEAVMVEERNLRIARGVWRQDLTPAQRTTLLEAVRILGGPTQEERLRGQMPRVPEPAKP